MRQEVLPLTGGHHPGPLFVVVKRRAPKLAKAFDGSRRIWGIHRRAAERRATPAWADRNLTASLFRLAAIYTKATGERFSVDHLVPLSHPLVCGLHVGDNLVPMLLADNMKKANCSWPDMPEVQLPLLL